MLRYGGASYTPITATITAGVGLTGGGLLSSSPTIDLDISTLTDDSDVGASDEIAIHDGAMKKVTRNEFETSLAILSSQFTVDADIDLLGFSIVDSTIHAGVGLSFQSTYALQHKATAANGAEIWNYSESVGASGYMVFQTQDDSTAKTTVSQFKSFITDSSTGAMTAEMQFGYVRGGNWVSDRVVFEFGATDETRLQLKSPITTQAGQIGFMARDSGSAYQDYCLIHAEVDDATATSEDSHLSISSRVGGALTEQLQVYGGYVNVVTDIRSPLVTLVGAGTDPTLSSNGSGDVVATTAANFCLFRASNVTVPALDFTAQNSIAATTVYGRIAVTIDDDDRPLVR
jgi:hypothetical protein